MLKLAEVNQDMFSLDIGVCIRLASRWARLFPATCEIWDEEKDNDTVKARPS